MQEMQNQFQSLGRKDPLEEEVVTHSSILAWEMLWTEEPDGLQSMEFQKYQTQMTSEHTYHMESYQKWKPIQFGAPLLIVITFEHKKIIHMQSKS